ncbi:class II aldolase/adducin family protein, partial [Streptomyces benahoarensis]
MTRTGAPAPHPDRPGADALAAAWDGVVATARRTVADGLVVGTSGNVSARVGDTVLVTPSGVPYDRLGPGDLTAVDLDGHQCAGTLTPTSELPMHLAVYRATDAAALVHTHAPHATAVSVLVDRLPPVHYMTAALGGPVRVAPYAPYG